VKSGFRLCVLPLVLGALAPVLWGAEGVSAPDRIELGGRPIVLPPPAGFVRSDGLFAKWDNVITTSIPAGNRMLAIFSTPADRKLLESQAAPPSERSFNAQIQRSLESRDVGERTFGEIRAELKSQLQAMSSRVGDEVRKAIEAGNKQRGVDTALAVNDTVFLGFLGDDPGSLGFAMAMKVGMKNSTESSRVVSAGMVTTVNGRMIFLYANATYETEADRKWAENSVQSWRNAIVAANPRVAGPSTKGFDWTQVGRSGIIGGVIGGIVGLLFMLARRRKAGPGS
jgi:hypothetical protein